MNEDRSTRYQRHQRLVSLVSLAWSVSLLAALSWSGAALTLRHLVDSVAGTARPTLAAGCYVTLLMLLHEVGALAASCYGGFVLERRYGLSTQTAQSWCADQIKAFVVSWLIGIVAAATIYGTIRVSPTWWWLLSGSAFALLFAVMANVAPVVLLPLFYTVKPLARHELRARLVRLADRAGTRVVGAYEWGLGNRSRKANAALAGLGATRRILVSDTMLAAYSDDEIEVVLAHELAHHVHGDIWKALLVESALMLVGFFVAAQSLVHLGPRLGLDGVADLAGLPLLVLAAGIVSLIMLPVTHAMSRAHERRADRFALELTRNPPAFISAMKRLGQQNLAEDHPSKLVEWWFYSHPPLRERISAAHAFRP